MEQLLTITRNQVLVSSRQVAEHFEKEHQHVTQAIENLISENSLVKNYFHESQYNTERGRSYKEYLMNRDGFSLLVMGFTGKKAHQWKLKYIEAFNQLEKIVQEKRTAEWVQARKQGKLTRQSETDVIKQLIEYAEEQGSINSDKLYLVYSKLANKMAGIQGREIATAAQLNHLEIMEHIILNCIHEGMKLGEHYKQIYKRCKARLEQFKYVAYLEQTA